MIQLILVLSLLTFTSCSQSDLFKLPSVKRVQSDYLDEDVEKLIEKSKGYERTVNRTIEAGDKLGDVYEAIALKFLFRQNWQFAIEYYEKAIANGNNGSDIHRRIASAFANRGRELGSPKDYDQALYHYKLAFEKKADNYDAYYGYALILFYQKGEENEALTMLQDVINQNPDFYEARFAYGRMLYETNDSSTALAVYQKLLDDLLNTEMDVPETYINDVRSNINRLTIELSAGEQ